MLGIAIPITTNNFIQQEDGTFHVTLTSNQIGSWLSTIDAGAVRCYRDDGTTRRQVLFYHEIDSDGNMIFHFDEAFAGKIVLSADS